MKPIEMVGIIKKRTPGVYHHAGGYDPKLVIVAIINKKVGFSNDRVAG